jgi:3-hydroxyisobutyrate dehydrogenase-like beta-hydroxyacid dehydrogenase
LNVRVVGTEIGQASGLKMLSAASTKGTIALWTEILVAARALGLEEALREEWGPTHPVARQLVASIPSMPRRARRWAGEMDEIAATFRALKLTPKMFEGAGELYGFIGETSLGEQTSRQSDPSLETLLQALTERLPD